MTNNFELIVDNYDNYLRLKYFYKFLYKKIV